jgi:hypothetical protein
MLLLVRRGRFWAMLDTRRSRSMEIRAIARHALRALKSLRSSIVVRHIQRALSWIRLMD